MSHTGKVCLVTGASSGIGREIAKQLAEKGCTVYGTTRRLRPGEVAKDGAVFMIALDTTDPQSVEQAVQLVEQREGRIDILVNNAGSGVAGPLEETSEEAAKAQMDVNFLGPFRMSKAVLPVMRKINGGRIVNVGSVAAWVPIPFQTLYSASKSALSVLTEGLAMEAKPFGVTCAMVDPGDTKTEFTARRQRTVSSASVYAKRYEASLARMEKDEQNGTPPEVVAKAVVRVALQKRMPTRKAVGFGYKVICVLARILPMRLKRAVIGKLYG